MNIGDRFIKELLDTKSVGDDTFRGERVFCPNSRSIYGGELMAQALVAASKTVSEDLKPNSLHCYFHNRSSVTQPNHYHVVRFRDSRSFSHRLVEAYRMSDGGETDVQSTAFFRMDCSFKTQEVDPACFVAPMPCVLAAAELQDMITYINCLDVDNLPEVPRNRIRQLINFDKQSPVELRVCEPDFMLGLNSNPGGRLHTWMRLKEPPTVDIKPYRDATLTYFSDAVLLWVAITEPHPVNYIVTLNQSVWFHNPDQCPRPDEWILFETKANYVGDALTLSYGSIWDKDGHLLASVAQQGLMRTSPITPQSSYPSLQRLDNVST